MKKTQRNNEFVGSGDVGNPLTPTPKSGGPTQANRKGVVPGFDARQRESVPGKANMAKAWDGPDSTRIKKKSETVGNVHQLRVSGGADETSAVQAEGDLGGSPAPKARRSRPRLNKKNASPIRSAARIPGAGEAPDKSEQMSSAMRAELRQAAENPEEN